MHAWQLSPSARIENEVLVHLLTRLSRTKALDEPFPHLFIENVFPDDIYQELLSAQPPLEMMAMSEKNRNADGNYNRRMLQLLPENLAGFPAAQAELWNGVHRAMCAPQFQRALFKKLANGLSYRYNIPVSEAADIEAYPRTTIVRETNGYAIAPHPDGRRKIVTTQFALPADNSQEHLGTTFYERSLDPRDWLTVPRGFRTAKQMPFRPNCAYAFVVLNTIRKKSWHGREQLSGETGTRNSLLHIYYADSEGEY